jgi:hypothetical protein
MMKKTISLATILALLGALIPIPVLAAGGTILYLIAWGGYAPDTTVYVQTTVQATTRVNNSNLYYTISLGGTLYATHTTSLPRLNAWETYTDEWTTVNTGWPEGDYTITVCWSTGNAQNCDIDGPVTTSYHFVPTLGWGLTVAAAGILLLGIWRRRREFEPAPERDRP